MSDIYKSEAGAEALTEYYREAGHVLPRQTKAVTEFLQSTSRER